MHFCSLFGTNLFPLKNTCFKSRFVWLWSLRCSDAIVLTGFPSLCCQHSWTLEHIWLRFSWWLFFSSVEPTAFVLEVETRWRLQGHQPITYPSRHLKPLWIVWQMMLFDWIKNVIIKIFSWFWVLMAYQTITIWTNFN